MTIISVLFLILLADNLVCFCIFHFFIHILFPASKSALFWCLSKGFIFFSQNWEFSAEPAGADKASSTEAKTANFEKLAGNPKLRN